MMRWSDMQLIATIFHELAHQKLYIKGDTAFNESFATAVADIGMSRWQDGRDEFVGADVFHENRALRQSMMTLVDASKSELGALYESDLGDDLKRVRPAHHRIGVLDAREILGSGTQHDDALV